MSRKTDKQDGKDQAGAVPHASSDGRFNTAELRFFDEGDAQHAQHAAAENFDDLADHEAHQRLKSRRRALAFGAGGFVLCLATGIVFWVKNEPAPLPEFPSASTLTITSTSVAAPSATDPAATVSTTGTAAGLATDAAPNGDAAADADAEAPAVAVPPIAKDSGAAPVAKAPVAAPGAAPVAKAPVAAPGATPIAKDVTPAPAAKIAAAEEPSLAERCTKAYSQHRAKDVLSVCSRALEAAPGSANVAVMLAKTEFDRGHSKEALAWAQKAVAANADTADAYVFIGMAEQEAGHATAAKTAYKRYLQLAPKGKYAGEIRSVVSNM